MHVCIYIERGREIEDEGLAGLRVTGIVLGRGGGGSNRRKKVRTKLMSFWHKMVFPVRRVWFAVATRVKSRKNGPGLLKLHDDIQTCGYEDVQVMWEMLRRTESEMISLPPKRKLRPFWKIFVWDNHTNKSTFSMNHA